MARMPMGRATNVRSWESNGLNADVAFGPFMDPKRSSTGSVFAYRSLWNIDVATLGSLGFDVGRPDYISPLLRIVDQEFPEVSWRQRHRDVSEAGDASPNFWI